MLLRRESRDLNRTERKLYASLSKNLLTLFRSTCYQQKFFLIFIYERLKSSRCRAQDICSG